MDMQDIGAAIARQEEQIKALTERMGNLEKLTDSVNKLAISLERLTAKEAAVETRVAEIADDVDELKDKPTKYWTSIVTALISALVGAGVAFLIK